MNHVIVLLVVVVIFRVLDKHGCNGQVSTHINPPPPLPFPPPPPGILQFPPSPPLKPLSPAALTHGSYPDNCCFDPYHCCDHDHDDSHSTIDVWLVVLVAAILLLLILAYIFFLFNFWGFRNFVKFIGMGLQNLIEAINENLVKSINGVGGAINTNLGANGPINRSLTAIDGKLGAIDGKLAAIPGPLLEISNRLENICPNCNVYFTVPPCKSGGSTCKCSHATCECGGSPCSP